MYGMCLFRLDYRSRAHEYRFRSQFFQQLVQWNRAKQVGNDK